MRLLPRNVNLKENLTLVPVKTCKQRHKHFSNESMSKTAVVIDGVKRANIIQECIRNEVLSLLKRGYQPPSLSTVVVGNNEVSHLYIKRKSIAANGVGISTRKFLLDSNVTEKSLIDLISYLNDDQNVNGILVQLPLPSHICQRKISNIIVPDKDVDGFSISNMGRSALSMDALWPCTALAVRDLILSTGIETRGKHAVICGRSKNVGLPIGMMLHARNLDGSPGMDATTTICHRYTPPNQLSALTKSADILISATGVPGLIRSSMVKPGACVIDVGITRIYDDRKQRMQLVGDVDFDGVSKVAGYLTPVPGGVGPMTVAMLLQNTLKTAKTQMKVI